MAAFVFSIRYDPATAAAKDKYFYCFEMSVNGIISKIDFFKFYYCRYFSKLSVIVQWTFGWKDATLLGVNDIKYDIKIL